MFGLLAGCLPMRGSVGPVATTSQHGGAMGAVEGGLSLAQPTKQGGYINLGIAMQLGYNAELRRVRASTAILAIDRWTRPDPWGVRFGLAFVQRNLTLEGGEDASVGGQAHLGVVLRTTPPGPADCDLTAWSLDLVGGFTGPIDLGGWFVGIDVMVHGFIFPVFHRGDLTAGVADGCR